MQSSTLNPRIFSLICFSLISFTAAQAKWNSISRGPYLLSDSDTSMNIRWRTKKPSPSILHYWQDGIYDGKKEAGDMVLTKDHEIELKGLRPDTKYHYELLCEHKGNREKLEHRGKRLVFTTPASKDQKKRLHIWVLGDPGTAGYSKWGNKYKKTQIATRNAYREYLKKRRGLETDLILSLGDNTYNFGTDEEYQRGVFDIYAHELTHVPFYPVFGNHDAGIDKVHGTYHARSYPRPHGVYYETFALPDSKAFYSFDYAQVHFVMLDSYDSYWEKLGIFKTNYEKVWTNKSEKVNSMLEWLKEDLAANKATWTVVCFHHPAFGDDNLNYLPQAKWEKWMRENVAPILNEHKVDLVMSGHIHNYQRSFPLVFEKTIEENSKEEVLNAKPLKDSVSVYKKGYGTIYVVMGSSGSAFSPTGKVSQTGLFAKQLQENGSIVLDINSKLLRLKFLAASGKILDKFDIQK